MSRKIKMHRQTDSSNPESITDIQRKRSMVCAYTTASLMTITMVCLTRNTLTLAAIKLGANEIFIGILSFAFAAPMAAQLFTISAMERLGKRRILLTWNIISIPFILPIVFTPQIVSHFSHQTALAVIFVCLLLWRTFASMAGVAWFPILQDIVPAERVGTFFGTMRTIWQSVWLITLIVIAFFLRSDSPQWWQFQIIFAVGFLMVVIKPFFLAQMSELPSKAEHKNKKPNILHRFKQLFSENSVLMYMLYAVSYGLPFVMVEPFKVKMLKDLGYSDSFIMIATAILGLGAVVSLRFWGKLADKFGNRSVFSISLIGVVIVTLLWLIVEKSTTGAVVVLILFLLSSVFNSANGIAQTRYMFHAVPAKKQYYIPLIQVTLGVTLAIAPILGGLLLYSIGDYRFTHGGLDLNNYHILFIISAILFAVPQMLRRGLRIERETSTRNVLAIVTRPLVNVFGMSIGFIKTKNQNNTNSSS